MLWTNRGLTMEVNLTLGISLHCKWSQNSCILLKIKNVFIVVLQISELDIQKSWYFQGIICLYDMILWYISVTWCWSSQIWSRTTTMLVQQCRLWTPRIHYCEIKLHIQQAFMETKVSEPYLIAPMKQDLVG